MKKTSILTLICAGAAFGLSFAQNVPNPVIPHVADAGVMKYNGKYYIGGVGTNGDFYVSDDLIHWNEPVHAVTMDNDWTRGTGAGNNQIHANDMFYLNGRFHLYWSVNYWGEDRHAVHITHAESDKPLGPYTEPEQTTWMDNRIDPKVFKDDDGQLYMYMVRFTEGNAIWVRKMKDPSTFLTEPYCLFASLPNTWETMDNRVAEGPWVIKYRDQYYMMYNANHTGHTWGNYQLGVAQADSPMEFNNGNKYSHPVVGSNQTTLEETYTDLLRYTGTQYTPQFCYSEEKPVEGWMEMSFNDSDWKKGEGGFASQKIAGSTARYCATIWKSPALWLRKKFTLPESYGHLALRVTHYGDTRIMLNGTVIYDKKGADYCMVNLTDKQRKALKKGENILAIETAGGRSNYFDLSLFDLQDTMADDILFTPGQPNILRGPNGFEWWLIYMANKNNESRDQYVDRVLFFDKTLYVDGITGPNTKGYHPAPALPSYSAIAETTVADLLHDMLPSNAYLFETSVCTTGKAGVVAWWKDEKNQAQVGLDASRHVWYLSVMQDGKETEEHFALPDDFKWGVYHHFRIERNKDKLKVFIDEIPAPGKHLFANAIPDTPGKPGTFDQSGNSRFEGTICTIGFDEESIRLDANEKVVAGERLDQYELAFQLYGMNENRTAGCYPAYIDEKNHVKAVFNGESRSLDVTVTSKGKVKSQLSFPLSQERTVYPDVKYTDAFEKNYRFSTPTTIDGLYLNRHDVSNKSDFAENMFEQFSVEYLANGQWHTLDCSKTEIAENPMYNHVAFEPIKAEGVRFINRTATDLRQHIYKIKTHELLKESYNLRAVRAQDKLYFFVDGHEVGMVELPFAASQIGFGESNYPTAYRGVMYYHVGTANRNE